MRIAVAVAARHPKQVCAGTPSPRRAVFVALLAASGVLAWHGTARPQPGNRELASAIYDPLRQRMVVFGGNSGTQRYNDTWQLTLGDHPQWSRLDPVGELPPKRLAHSAIYDGVRDRMIVFGGLDSVLVPLDDIWALSLSDPVTWTRLEPPLPGPTRYFHSAIHDSLRNRMLVFGGSDETGASSSDVWSLSLGATSTWERVPARGTSPPARYSQSAVYEPVRDRMLVFGGFPRSNDVWEMQLGDTTWTLLQPSGSRPSPRLSQTAIYDDRRGRMVVFGGNDGSQRADVWALSLAGAGAWSQLPATGAAVPSSRQDHSAVYDPVHDRMVVFGGYPSVNEPTWALDLAGAARWSPLRPVIELPATALQFPIVTVGDTVSVALTISNTGLVPLRVEELRLPRPEMRISLPAPLEIPWRQSVTETLTFIASEPAKLQDSVVVVSSDPNSPRQAVNVVVDARGLEFRTRIFGDPVEAPLADSLLVIATPDPGVQAERGTLLYRIADGRSEFDSLTFTRLSADFIASIPASAVTEYGVEYFVRVENSGFIATQPAGAPGVLLTQRVAAPVSVAAVPRPVSGTEFLTGRDIEVEALLAPGASFVAGGLHYRQGGEADFQIAGLALNGAGRPAATIPAAFVGPRGVEYWLDMTTVRSSLRFPAAAPTFAVIRTRVQGLPEPLEHPGLSYRLLSVPLDFGSALSGSLGALLTDQFGTYDPTRWRAFAYDPVSLRNIELSFAEADRFQPKPGRAFWLVTRDAHRVDTSPIDGFSTPTDRDFEIPLAAGWNQFGNPFDFPVAWSDVRRDGSVVDQGPEAYDAAAADHYSTALMLTPFEGYFIHATQPTTLYVPPRATATSVTRDATADLATLNASMRSAAREPSDQWRFRLRASTASAADGAIDFGVNSAAKTGADPLDRRKPPSPPGQRVRAAIVHPKRQERSREYRSDLRHPDTEGETWEIEVWSGSPVEPVLLEVSELLPLPSGIVLRLIDREQGGSVDWPRTAEDSASTTGASNSGAGTTIQYRILPFAQRPYHLAIVAGTPAYVAQASQLALAVPARTTLDQNAPNPFVDATRIRFGLPREEQVSLEIYSVAGQRVAKLLDRAPLGPGTHTLVWDGRESSAMPAPSGVYFLQLAVGNEVLRRRIVRIR